MRFAVLLLAPVLCAAQTCDSAPANRRYALVVGNGGYTHLAPAATAVADSRMMQHALEGAGFGVTLIENATMPDLFDNVQKAFLEKIQPGDIVFFYYSGHIVQGPYGDSFILGVNFDPLGDINQQGFAVERFLEEVNHRKPGMTVAMVEGPRRVGTQIKEVTRAGLAVPDILRDMGRILFAMSAQRGEVVVASPELKVDLFTKAVAQRLATPGLALTDLFEQARQDVISETDRRQLPEVQPFASGGFCFVPPIVTPTRVDPPPPVVKQVVVVETVPNNRKDHEEYVRISAGTFKMGCVPNDSKCKADEKPQREVTISKDYWIGRNEVEVGPFLRFWRESNEKKKNFPQTAPMDYRGWIRDNLPMVRVTWDQAQGYCHWVGGRLPTEAEWEYAARAGAADEIYPLNNENSRDKANFAGQKGNDIFEGVAPVRSFDPSGFNLYDMAGNVWEWVFDWYDANYYKDAPSSDPQGPPAGKEHIVRGGSFESSWQDHLRLSLRLPQSGENFKTGFRCALDDTPATRELLGVH